MIIKIDDERKLADIQREFNSYFPNLKIEFFADAFSPRGKESVVARLGGDSLLRKARVLHTNGFLSIEPEMSASELVNNCREFFGLNIRIYQNEGEDSWKELDLNSNLPLKVFSKSKNVSTDDTLTV